MAKNNPSYYAIIPANVRYANISPNAKLLYGEITALCSKEGFCWASNKYFADLYSVNVTTVSGWIRELAEINVIDYSLEKGKNRKIVLREKAKHPSEKGEASASEKGEHSITSSITTLNKISPYEVSKEFFSSETKRLEMIETLVDRGADRDAVTAEIGKFIDYWTEPNQSGKKLRWEGQKFFYLPRRLGTWFKNVRNFSGGFGKGKGIKVMSF